MSKIYILLIIILFTIPTSSSTVNINAEVIPALGYYSNSSLNLNQNQPFFIEASKVNITLEIITSQNTIGSIEMVITPKPLDNIPNITVPSFHKYLRIEPSDSIIKNLSYVLIKFHYTDEDLKKSGIEENSMNVYKWNNSAYKWEKLTPALNWVHDSGVNTVENYIWVNLTHFSDYTTGGILITPTPKPTPPTPCFIATAAYGSPLHEDINVLRDFRDTYLMTNTPGRFFVKTYYATSPPIADFIREHENIRLTVRDNFVRPLVEIVRPLVK